MRILGFLLLLAGFMAVTVGCDWTAGGGVEGWNSRFNWVNFSGVYRGIGGGVLVTDFTATPGTPGVTNTVASESAGTANGADTVFNGVVAHKPVVPGSFSISTTVGTLTDNGDGTLSGGGKTGSIDYGTGAWSIDLAPSVPVDGTPIVVSYQYTVAGSTGSGGAGPGSSGASIFSFTVFQEGETLSITDNNGAVYNGNMGSIRTSGGIDQQERGGTPVPGSTVIAQYSASGVAASGLSVEMVGTFQGVVGAAGQSLADRRMFGTWIESGGRSGDINGQASPVQIVFEDVVVE